MPTTRTFSRSFAGGELSPEMFGRIDDQKFQSGAATMRNFVALPQGPAQNRAGTRFVREVRDSTRATRIIPFTYSTSQTMVIELGQGYVRFHTQGATLLAGTGAAWSNATAYVVGDLVSLAGSNYYCILAHTNQSPPNATYWYPLGAVNGPYEIPSPYQEADLFSIHHVQSADVLTLVHPNYPPRELRRLGATTWTLTVIPFVPAVSAPATPTVTASPGESQTIANFVDATDTFETNTNHQFAVGDPVYIRTLTTPTGLTGLPDGFYVIRSVPGAATFTLKSYTDGSSTQPTGAYNVNTLSVQLGPKIADIDNYYVVTSIAGNGTDESTASASGHVVNNLYVNGAYNTISWSAVSGAIRYNVYKRQSGLYGYIGQTEATSFTDDNISPDMGLTPPVVETVFASAGNYPGAVSYFEQRRVFAGTNNEPQKLWLTRSGTESDMSYRIPVKDDDRISFRVAAREANTIRHVVPLSQLLLLTSAAEWRVSPVNSDAITPSTISVRPQSYIGANNVQPSIINNSMVYCAARGGHVRELGYSWQSNGYITGDLSLRAAHLFDTHDIVDMTYSKAPQPLVWFVSSTGRLLGLTYVPEQQIGAWHQHDTDGTFESCASVSEGTEDVLYVVVRRTVDSATVRYVEQFQTREVDLLEDCFFVDAGSTYDGNNTTATTVTVTGGTTWGPSETLTITASTPIFAFPATTDIGDAFVFTSDDGTRYRLTITGVTSTTVVSAMPDKILAVEFRDVPLLDWAFARNTVSGLSHLEGKTVSILADGAVQPQEVVESGTVSIDRAAVKIHVGLPYASDLQTLPLAINIDAFGQGRVKNINQAWVRVFRSSGLFVGPSTDRLTEAKMRTTEPYGDPPALRSDEINVSITPSWAQGGQVVIRQADPLPLTVVGMTIEAVVGA